MGVISGSVSQVSCFVLQNEAHLTNLRVISGSVCHLLSYKMNFFVKTNREFYRNNNEDSMSKNGILGPGVFNINKLLDRHVLKLQKKRNMKTQIFHHSKNIINLQKILSKKPKIIPSRLYNSMITNLKFQHKKKKYHLSNIILI